LSTILIVDDDPSIRFMVRLIVERAGHELVEAQHGAAAIARLAETLPDLILTDMMMPVMDGEELIQRLRANPETASLPILVISGNPDARQAATGADAVLGKPFAPSRLVEMVTELLAAGETRGKA
jgi:CheY-like chemotaxis protein